MKIKQICMMLLAGLGLIPVAQAQTFDNLWKEVEQAQKKSLPQTVVKLTDEIFRKGEQEKNSAQMLKAYTWRINAQQSLTPDSFYVSLNGLEQWAKQTDRPTDRAVLHSLIANLYADYAASNRWQLQQRTEIVGETSAADIREWTANMFVEKVRTHAKESLADPQLLLNTSSRDYIPFVEQGESSEYYHHDMYHLLASRAVQALDKITGIEHSGFVDLASSAVKQDIVHIYQNMLTTYEKAGLTDGYIMTALDFQNWKRKANAGYATYEPQKGLAGLLQDNYFTVLDALKSRYASRPIVMEVYLAQARYAAEKEEYSTALSLCNEAIKTYPNYRRINALKNLCTEIMTPRLNVQAENQAFPGEEIKLRVSHKNLDGFTVQLFHTKKQAHEQHYSLHRPADYRSQDTVFMFKAPELGDYVMRIVPDTPAKRNSESNFTVTRFRVLTCQLPGKQYEVVVLDGQTGHPVPNATVTLYDREEKAIRNFVVDKEGKAIFPWESGYRYLKATKGADTFMKLQGIYEGDFGYYNSGDRQTNHITLLTDRSLYRPGQTVYVKGVSYTQQGDDTRIVADKEYEVSLLDANRQKVAQKKVRTNEFGSFATDFSLPVACLNGMFVIQVDDERAFFRVEEYKRPTFDVIFEKQTGSYQLGDSVLVKGKIQSYSGVMLQELPVKYTVNRSTYDFWRISENEQIASGEVVTDADGNFVILVCLEESLAYKNNDRAYYRYSIEATATNVAGETQSSVETIAAGRRSLILQADLKGRTCKDKPFGIVFKVQNLNEQPVKVKGDYALYLAKNGDFGKPDDHPVMTGTFTSNLRTTVDWTAIPSGAYVLKATVKDNQGKEVTTESNIVLFSREDKRPPVRSAVWLDKMNIEFDDAHPAMFNFGTSEKDAYVLMDVFCDNKRLENRVLHLSDTIVRFEYPYRESYGDGILVNFCFVKNGKLHQEQVQLKRRRPDKTLTLKWEVFRDKLRPGQQEEWRLTIKTPQGQAAEAEMLVTMYDASLDKIWSRQQEFQIGYKQMNLHFSRRIAHFGDNWFSHWWDNQYLNVPSLVYDRFAENIYMRMFATTRMVAGVGATSRKFKSTMAKTELLKVANDEAPVEVKYVPVLVEEEPTIYEIRAEADAGASLPETPAGLRTNLSETAFFYPQLRTNEQGEISFVFTMPESLTRWNFRGYAHTKEMQTGTLEGEAVTSKEFMLTSNLPRFVRVGDKTSVAASISNLTGETQAGTVSMTLFDPLTEKVIGTQQQKFSVEAGKTIGVSFQFTVSDKYEILGCRMVADSGTFSDGEQQLLPVLSNKVHLVETLPMPIRGEESRTFSLDPLFNRHSKTATDRKLTVEFTGNPAWYAVQALPSLSLPTSDDAIAWATAYYANTLASYIMNSQPRIKAVFDSWKLQGGTKETFLSNLQKNQDVKNILLSESPWVLEAQTEEQQKERIATLFDLNNVRSNHVAALTKLKELQGSDGAWSWYKGMNGSSYVTAYIAELNARLALLTGEKLNDTALSLQANALKYLHRSALEEYKNILKAQKEGVKFTGVSGSILQYLYIIAISGEQVPAANKAAYAYYLSKVKELLPSRAMDTKAMAAIVLDKAGRKNEAKEFVASLKEHLTKTDEQGMFFAFNENPYTWTGIKMRAHVDVMEALGRIDDNAETVEEMKLWLLKQKQTQQWDSPVTTADAIYALLMKGTNLLDNQGDVRIVLADEVMETVSPSKTTVPGLGYIKRSFTQKKVVDARKIEVEKRTPGIAWGAVYATYESPISDVNQQGGELNVQKQLYVERMADNVPQLQPVTAKTTLRIGDKIVSRLVIRTDRAMDFVQLKDQCAACFEPVGSISGYRWNNGIGYYVDIKDASTNFFFDSLGKGVYVLEHSYRVSRAGTYEVGLATMQCAYAPEYASHSASATVNVAE